jgi:hypothetical protein
MEGLKNWGLLTVSAVKTQAHTQEVEPSHMQDPYTINTVIKSQVDELLEEMLLQKQFLNESVRS